MSLLESSDDCESDDNTCTHTEGEDTIEVRFAMRLGFIPCTKKLTHHVIRLVARSHIM